MFFFIVIIIILFYFQKLLNQREQQYKDHKTYKEAYEELSNFLNRSRDKIPLLKERPLSDKLAIENAITPLENLLNKRAQGELLLDNLNTIGDVIIASTSENGEKIIKQEISSISEDLNKLFDGIKKKITEYNLYFILLFRTYRYIISKR